MDNINRAKGHGIVAKRTAYEWFSKFKNNQMEIADKKRAGRPREIDRAAVVNTVEAHPSMTTRMLAEDFDCAQARTWRQVISTYSDRWSTGCVEKSSKPSKKCAKVLKNSLHLRTEIGTAVG